MNNANPNDRPCEEHPWCTSTDHPDGEHWSDPMTVSATGEPNDFVPDLAAGGVRVPAADFYRAARKDGPDSVVLHAFTPRGGAEVDLWFTWGEALEMWQTLDGILGKGGPAET